MQTLNRREFFSKFLTPFKNREEEKLRLPYSASDRLFSNVCVDCSGRCAYVCEENIIKMDGNRIPYLDFSENGCSYCAACLTMCENEVLTQGSHWQIPAAVKIDPTLCLAWQENICSLCTDSCDPNCIRMEGMLNPQIDQLTCTSCGICVSKCPVQAIQVTPIKREENNNEYFQRAGSGEA